jgi:flagellar basal body-associated protein FliL
MMAQLLLLDIPPDPRGVGALLAVVLLVIGFVVLLAVGLAVFLWYRKRSLRGAEMIRPDAAPAGSARHAQPSNPNQP